MALALYSDAFWFPDGSTAANVPARVFQPDNSTLATLWADQAGTIPLANPLPTDGVGVLTFYATVGSYWLHLDTEAFPIDVGLTQEQADLSTGVASGGELDPSGVNPQAVVLAPLVGYVVDNSDVLSIKPQVIRVDSPGGTFPLVGASLTRSVTWWLMDSAGTVLQQATRPTPTQRRTHLVLGVSAYDTVGGAILEAQTLQVILPQQANQLADLMDALGPFSLSGNVVSPNGANLMINKTAGVLFSRSFNHFASGVLTDDPHVSASAAQTPATFRRILRTASAVTPGAVTTLDPANYDVGGVLTPVPGGANASTIQRVYAFAANGVNLQLAVHYGQVVYGSLSAATAAIASGVFEPAPITTIGAMIGYIAVIRTATNLSDPTQATFVHAEKFATP